MNSELSQQYRGYELKQTRDGISVYRKDAHIGMILIDTYPNIEIARSKIDRVCELNAKYKG